MTAPEHPWSLGYGYREDPRFTGATPEFRAAVEQFHDEGVAVFRALVPPPVIAAARAAAAGEFERSGPGVPDGKLADGWRTSPAIRQLAICPEVVDVVERLHGRRAIPFQTLTFRCGSGQAGHADSVHFDSVPSGWMCGAWVALEDVGPTQGPLEYDVGSHRDLDARAADALLAARVPYADYERALAESSPGERTTFRASAGDVLVWAAHLVHGGSPVTDPDSTRWSQVTHYFFDGCAYVTPMAGDPDRGLVALRDELTDLRTGRRVRHVVDGQPARVVRVGHRMARLLDDDEPRPGVATSIASGVRGAIAGARWRARRWQGATRRRGRSSTQSTMSLRRRPARHRQKRLGCRRR